MGMKTYRAVLIGAGQIHQESGTANWANTFNADTDEVAVGLAGELLRVLKIPASIQVWVCVGNVPVRLIYESRL